MIHRGLNLVWNQQHDYNERIKKLQSRTDSEWMINYILGTMTEMGELLQEVKWKDHRISSSNTFGPNIKDQLADITKYVFSMWQVLGCSEDEMLEEMFMKGDVLEQLAEQEMAPDHIFKKIIMLDLDGVVADFRAGFEQWLKNSAWDYLIPIDPTKNTLHLDINYGWDFNTYTEAKLEFERQGGYNSLPAIEETVDAINTLFLRDYYIIVHTARPYTALRRVWVDTFKWLRENHVSFNELHFGYDSRVTYAKKLANSNLVIAMEDDPVLIQRYSGSGISTLVFPQLYNRDLPVSRDIHELYPEDTQVQIVKLVESIVMGKAKSYV